MTRAVITLGTNLEIRDVEAVRALWLDALDGTAGLQVHVGSLVTVDTAGAQLLLSLRSEGALRGVDIDFVGQSAALTQTLDQLGLGGVLRGAVTHDR